MAYQPRNHNGTAPICPYCDKPSTLTDSTVIYGRNYGWLWACLPCDAYVGVHRGTTNAMGTLANKELRAERKLAHAALDPLWRDGPLNRKQAYELLAELLDLADPKDAHIAKLNEEQCRLLVQQLKRRERGESTDWPINSDRQPPGLGRDLRAAALARRGETA